MKQELCKEKSCINYQRYCRLHLQGSLKPKKHINPRSAKLEKIMKKQYRPQVKEMVEAGTLCRVKSPVCTKVAQGFHHLSGRVGDELLSVKKIPCCNKCNSFIEQNDAWARSNGFKLSRHHNYKRKSA